ncbi:MAG: hypothetical protein SVV67_08695 [Bacillota bacterium]|nr:hypothetical protein [Bacillota bacterium]
MGLGGSIGGLASSAISGPAALAVGAIANSGGELTKNKAKNKEETAAAERDEGQQKLWDEFQSFLFGSPDKEYERFDIDYYIKNNPEVSGKLKIDPGNITDKDRKKAEKYYKSGASIDADYYILNNPDIVEAFGIDLNNITDKDRKKAKRHWEKYGQYEGRQASDAQTYDPDTVIEKSYRERLGEDIDYTKNADTSLIDALSNITASKNEADEKYGGTLQELMDTYSGVANASPVNVSGAGISGGPWQLTTGSQRRAADNIADWGGVLNKLAYSTGENDLALAQAQNALAHTYTPNKIENEYMNYLQGRNDFYDTLRYKTPTTISTGETSPSILSQLGTLMSGAGGIASIAR